MLGQKDRKPKSLKNRKWAWTVIPKFSLYHTYLILILLWLMYARYVRLEFVYASCRNTRTIKGTIIIVVLKLFIKVLFPESVWLGTCAVFIYHCVSWLFSYMTLMQIVLTLTVQPLDYHYNRQHHLPYSSSFLRRI